ncbi:hypothetical protein C0585_02095, partial [Candidatus Woesearchaeota archaeon]
MDSMFSYADAFNQDLNQWNTSSVVYMTCMFCETDLFNGNISTWDVSSVESAESMFYNAIAFNSDMIGWNFSSASTNGLAYMFYQATSFNGSVENWSFGSSATYLTSMFYGATSFNRDVSTWDVSGIQNMDYLFQGATSFNQDLNYWNVESVTSMRYMLDGATSFNGNVSGWDTSSVQDMEYLFKNTSVNQDLGDWNISSVTDMQHMFDNVTLSTAKYDSLLIGWASQAPNIQDSVTFSGGNSKYSIDALSSRNDTLIGIHSWTITDGGMENQIPDTPSPVLVSVDGLNNTDSDLNCSAVLADIDGDDLNVSVRWYRNNVLNLSVDYNNSYANGTLFNATLDSSYTSPGDVWNCSIQLYDGYDYSGWGNSSNLTINYGYYFCPDPTGNWTISSSYELNEFASCNIINITSSGTLISNAQNVWINTSNIYIYGILTHKANTNSELYKLNVTADNMTIYSVGSINLNGKGYLAGYGTGSPGYSDWGNMEGGAYGGEAGPGTGTTVVYGSLTNPINLGSGGGTNTYQANGDGGGAALFNVSDTLIIDGSITANGLAGVGSTRDDGGGSGGSVYIYANKVEGNSYISANGGNAYEYGGAGGGGRIAIYYGNLSDGISITAYGGSNGGRSGASGTIYLKADSQTYGDLIINNNNLNNLGSDQYSYSTPIISDQNFSSITIKNYAILELRNGMDVISENINISNVGTLSLLSGSTINYTNLTWDGGTIAAFGGTIPLLEQDELTILDTHKLVLNVPLDLNTLIINGTITNTGHQTSELYKINITANNLTINNGGSINTDGKGYLAGYGPGSTGNSDYANVAGASYGGIGGHDSDLTYGSLLYPINIGSGGGTNTYDNSGDGGGAIILNVNYTLIINGSITANGLAGIEASRDSGGGSGGTITIFSKNILGTSSMSANGGAAYEYGGSGSGGRIALYYENLLESVTMGVNGGSAASEWYKGKSGSILRCNYYDGANCYQDNGKLVYLENGIMHKTAYSIIDTIEVTRKPINYTNSKIFFNETSSNSACIASHNFSGLQNSKNYHIFEEGAEIGVSPLITDGSGNLPGFDILINQDKEILLTIDLTGPEEPILNYPENGANLSTSYVNFNWTAKDNVPSILCNLTIDGIVNQSDIFSIVNESTNHTVQLYPGDYLWNVTCFDYQGRKNHSETRNFTVLEIDVGLNFSINPVLINTSLNVFGYINYSDGQPVSNNRIDIYINGSPINISSLSSWWDTDWKYRDAFTLFENSDENLSNYSIEITLDTQNLISQSKLNNDCSDIRFTYGDSELDYWIENQATCNTSSTVIWVKTDLNASSNKTIYFYYGNPEGQSKSNISNTLLWYDGFDQNTLSDYNQIGGTWAWSSGYVTNPSANVESALIISEISESNVEVVVRGKSNDNDGTGAMVRANGVSTYYTCTSDPQNNRCVIGENAGRDTIIASTSQTQGNSDWITTTLKIFGSDLTCTCVNGADTKTVTAQDTSLTTGNVGALSYYNLPSGNIDYILVRKYTYPEPNTSFDNQEEYYTRTDSNGFYNYTFISPDLAGIYEVIVNLTSNGIYGENTENLTVYLNTVPTTPTVTLLSVDGLNNTDSDLNCSAVLADNDGDDLNVTVRWYLDGALNQTVDYNNSYVNGTLFNATLDSSYTSPGDAWNCSVRLYDGNDYSGWGNSSNLTISTDVTCYNCTDCSNKIQTYTGTGYKILLNNSIINSAATCIDFNGADSVIFDCQGLMIDGTGGNYGVDMPSASNNNVIQNCHINNFNYNFYPLGSSGNDFINITSTNSSTAGFWIDGTSDNNDFYNIISVGNLQGFWMRNSDSNNVTLLYSDDTNYAVYFREGNQNNIFDSLNVTGTSTGIYTYIGTNPGTTVTNSIFSDMSTGIMTKDDSGYYSNITVVNTVSQGIYVDGTSNTFTGLNLTDNGNYGMYFSSGTSGTEVYNSTFSGSSYELYFSSSSGNLFSNNTFSSSYKMYSPNGNVFNNTLTGNHWTGYDSDVHGCYDVSPTDGFCDDPYSVGTTATDYLPIYTNDTNTTDVYCYDCADCSNKIQTYAPVYTIILNNSISNSAATCIDFDGKDSTTFDCQGLMIDGTGGNYGVDMPSGSNNNVIQNCHINNFNYNFYLDGSLGNDFIDVISSNASSRGFDIDGSSHNNLFYNITSVSNPTGFWLRGSDNNNITLLYSIDPTAIYLYDQNENNIFDLLNITSSNYGIYSYYGTNPGTTVTNSFFTGYTGISTKDNHGYYRNITIVDTSYAGVMLGGGSNKTFTGLNLTNNGNYGMYFGSGTTGTEVYNSTIIESLDDLYFSSSTGNLFSNNTFSSSYKMYSPNGNVFNNTLTGNHWTAYDSDVHGCYDVSPTDGFCDDPYSVGTTATDYLPIYTNDTNTTDVYCYNCADCSNKIQTYAPVYTIILNNSISNSAATCIDFDGKDSTTFDCQGLTIDGTGGNYGIYLSSTGDDSNNNVIKNCVINNFNYNVYILDSVGNDFFNISSTSSSNSGFYIDSNSHNNLFYNITSSGNGNGFWLRYSDGNNITLFQSTDTMAIYLREQNENSVFDLINATGTSTGIYSNAGSNHGTTVTNSFFSGMSTGIQADDTGNYYRNITVLDTSFAGISISGGSGGTFINLNLSGNNYGMYISPGTSNNIYNSTITNSGTQGIYLSSSNSNNFYNNYFNNTDNIYSTSSSNYFNTTNQTGPNIINGDNIGGNYWSDYSGSDTNGDGFGETAYAIDGSNFDYLPLVIFDPTVICYNCTDCSDKIQSYGSGYTILLNNSISNYADGTCVNFNGADNVTFDCQGNTIDGTDVASSYGISLPNTGDGNNNNVVKNCVVSDFYYNFLFIKSDSSNFTNLVSSSSSDEGLLAASVTN